MEAPGLGAMAGISGLGAVLGGIGEGMQTRKANAAKLASEEAAERLKEQGESHTRELNTLSPEMSAALWQVATGKTIPIGANGKPMALPQPMAQTLLLAGLREQGTLGAAATRASAGNGKLSAKSDENVQRVSQAMTNLQNLADTYTRVNGEKLGMAGTLGQIPGGGGLLALPGMKNLNPGYTELNTAAEDAKNAYTRATLGRVSGDMLKSAMPLHNIAGVNPQVAKAQLDQLANSLKGVSNGVVNEIRMQKGDEAGDQAQQFFDQQFGSMRFFPQQETPPGAAAGTGYKTNQPAAEAQQPTTKLQMAPDHIQKLQAVPPTDPRYQQVQNTLKAYGVGAPPATNPAQPGAGL